MLKPSYTKQFDKDLKRMLKSGRDKNKIKKIIGILINQREPDKKYRDHKLTGNYQDRRECHIEPDWLLIYQIKDGRIIFERTGSHADLFR